MIYIVYLTQYFYCNQHGYIITSQDCNLTLLLYLKQTGEDRSDETHKLQSGVLLIGR